MIHSLRPECPHLALVLCKIPVSAALGFYPIMQGPSLPETTPMEGVDTSVLVLLGSSGPWRVLLSVWTPVFFGAAPLNTEDTHVDGFLLVTQSFLLPDENCLRYTKALTYLGLPRLKSA